MATLRKKFLQNNAVDETKIRLNNAGYLKARNAADSADVNIVRINSSNAVEFPSIPKLVGTPSASDDVASVGYVQSVLEGLDPKEAVRVASTANVAIATALENGDVIDGVTLVTGDRVLLKNQSDPIENGIYIVPASGAASRSSDMNQSSEFIGAYTLVRAGTVGQGQGYVCSVPNSFVMGTDPATFVLFKAAADFVAGNGINITGTTISVELTATSGLEFSSGDLQINLEASNPNLEINGSNELRAKLNTSAGLSQGASGINVDLLATGGLEFSTGDIAINLEASNPSLEINGSNELKAKLDAAGAIISGAGGLSIQQGDGLAISANTLAIDLVTNGGLEFSGGQLQVEVDAVTVKKNGSGALESLKQREQKITLGAGDITNQYVDLAFAAFGADGTSNSLQLTVIGGIIQEKGVDYTVSLTGGAGGVTRVTFAGDLATAGAAALVAADILVINYSYLT